jgi:U3 small nucleolar RNA-associated protein 13
LKDSHLVLATNSPLIRVYSATTQDTRLLEGHTDVVLSLDHGYGGTTLAGGGKDKSARIWVPFSGSNCAKEWGWGCVGVCEGHAESGGAIPMSRKAGTDDEGSSDLRFMFTGSQERTIKMWDLSQVPFTSEHGNEPVKCSSFVTLKAHDKNINSLNVTPNVRLLDSGSQDKTTKVYEIEYASTKAGLRGKMKPLGVCNGHKRGIWTVHFSVYTTRGLSSLAEHYARP